MSRAEQLAPVSISALTSMGIAGFAPAAFIAATCWWVCMTVT